MVGVLGGAGNLWDLQLNLLRHFPVGRASDWLRGVRASLAQLSGAACHQINTGLFPPLPLCVCLSCLLSHGRQLLLPALNQ